MIPVLYWGSSSYISCGLCWIRTVQLSYDHGGTGGFHFRFPRLGRWPLLCLVWEVALFRFTLKTSLKNTSIKNVCFFFLKEKITIWEPKLIHHLRFLHAPFNFLSSMVNQSHLHWASDSAERWTSLELIISMSSMLKVKHGKRPSSLPWCLWLNDFWCKEVEFKWRNWQIQVTRNDTCWVSCICLLPLFFFLWVSVMLRARFWKDAGLGIWFSILMPFFNSWIWEEF